MILSPHVLLDQENPAQLIRKLSDPFFQEIRERNLQALHLMQTTPGRDLFDRPKWLLHPDHGQCQFPWRMLKARLLRAGIERVLSQSDRLDDFLRETLVHFLDAEQWKVFWPQCRLQFMDLKMGDLLYCGVFIREFMPDLLTEAEHTHLEHLLVEKGLRAYLLGIEAQEWWATCPHNWNSATHGNAGLLALHLEASHPDLCALVLTQVRAGLRPLIEAFPAEGGWTEGMMYCTTALAHLTDFVAALDRVKGTTWGIAENPRIHATLDWRRHFLAPDGKVFNFSNCSTNAEEWPMAQVYWWAIKARRPEWASFEDAHPRPFEQVDGVFHDVEAFLYREANQPTADWHVPSGLSHFRGLDWLSWRGGDAWFALRAGFSGGNHNQHDLGSFIFGVGEDRLVIDPGYGVLSASEHSTVTFKHLEQLWGATCPILRAEVSGEFAHIIVDLAPAQPGLLAVHLRHFILAPLGMLVIVDYIRSKDYTQHDAKYHLQLAFEPSRHSTGLGARFRERDVLVLLPCPTANLEITEKKAGSHYAVSWQDDRDGVETIHATMISTQSPCEINVRGREVTGRLGTTAFVLDTHSSSLRLE